jgi:hypothetical protein
LINRAAAIAIARHHEAKFLTEIWKQIEFSKTEEDSVRERNQYTKLKGKKGVLQSFSVGLHAEVERGTSELRSLLSGKRSSTRKDWIERV